MPRSLVAISITIGLQSNGHADYPPFNTLASVIADGNDWSYYVDRVGIGWCYDATSGHKQGGATPVGVQEGCLLVPQAFADEAVAAFGATPYNIKKVTPAEFATFYDTRSAVRMPEETVSTDALKRIDAKRAASIPLSKADDDALDPAKDEPGINKNMRRHWVDRAVLEDVTVIDG